jgi:hypothetical protein
MPAFVGSKGRRRCRNTAELRTGVAQLNLWSAATVGQTGLKYFPHPRSSLSRDVWRCALCCPKESAKGSCRNRHCPKCQSAAIAMSRCWRFLAPPVNRITSVAQWGRNTHPVAGFPKLRRYSIARLEQGNTTSVKIGRRRSASMATLARAAKSSDENHSSSGLGLLG